MKGKDALLIIGGLVVGYQLMPEKVREQLQIPGGGGGSSIGLDFLPEINLPEINISEVPGVTQIIEIVKEVPEKIPDPTSLIPNTPENPGPPIPTPQEIIDYIMDKTGAGDGGGPGLPDPRDLIDTAGLGIFDQLGMLGGDYLENLKKGILGIAGTLDMVTGGWQEKFDAPNAFDFAKHFIGTDAYKAEHLLTDYAKAALERGTPVPGAISTETINPKDAPAVSESRPTFLGGSTRPYSVVNPTPDPRFGGKLSIVGVLSGPGTTKQAVHSSGKEAPPATPTWWMFT